MAMMKQKRKIRRDDSTHTGLKVLERRPNLKASIYLNFPARKSCSCPPNPVAQGVLVVLPFLSHSFLPIAVIILSKDVVYTEEGVLGGKHSRLLYSHDVSILIRLSRWFEQQTSER
jgi:hypothetical protein